jgi:hypothetical protein
VCSGFGYGRDKLREFKCFCFSEGGKLERGVLGGKPEGGS